MTNELKQEWISLNLKEERQTEKAQQSWTKYYNKEYSDVVKVGEYYFPIEKSRIEKDFCFGYGLNGVSTQEEYEGARAAEEKAKANEKYFLNENLSKLNQEISILEMYLQANMDAYEFYKLLVDSPYYHAMDYGKIYLYKNYRNRDYQVNYCIWDEERDQRRMSQYVVREATKDEIETILNAYKEEKERFVKRLNTYLKKYGTSKLHTWTYLVD